MSYRQQQSPLFRRYKARAHTGSENEDVPLALRGAYKNGVHHSGAVSGDLPAAIDQYSFVSLPAGVSLTKIDAVFKERSFVSK